jgi:hypothetical protein
MCECLLHNRLCEHGIDIEEILHSAFGYWQDVRLQDTQF